MTLFLRLALVLAVLVASVAAGAALSPERGARDALGPLEVLSGPALPALDGRVVVVTFFASWCPPCRVEFEHLNRLDAAHGGKGLVIVAVNYLEAWGGLSDDRRLRRFLDRARPSFTVVRGDDDIARRFGGVDRLPTLFVFDRRGRAAFTFVHRYKAKKQSVDYEELVAAVTPLLRAR